MPGRRHSVGVIILTTLVVLLLAADPALAYLGPGTGLEFVPYFLAILATAGVALLSILLYPIYAVIRFFRGPKVTPKPATPEVAPDSAAASAEASRPTTN